MRTVGDTAQVASKIQELYKIIKELETMFPETRFTLDGHTIGSIGEVLAAEKYGLRLLNNSAEKHDAIAKDGRMIQIKTTQIERISISSKPDYLIVIQINKEGNGIEIYNGPGQLPWENAGKLQKNGQRMISLSKLKHLMEKVPQEERIKSTK